MKVLQATGLARVGLKGVQPANTSPPVLCGAHMITTSVTF